MSDSTSSEVEELIIKTGLEVDAYITRAEEIFVRNAEVLRSDDPADGLTVLASSTDGLNWLLEFSQACRTLPRVEKLGLLERFESFDEQVVEAVGLISSAIEDADAIMLADVVEFELVPCLQSLRETVRKLLVVSGDHDATV